MLIMTNNIALVINLPKNKTNRHFSLCNMGLIRTKPYFARSLKQLKAAFTPDCYIVSNYFKLSTTICCTTWGSIILQFLSLKRCAFVAKQIVMLIDRKSLNFN